MMYEVFSVHDAKAEAFLPPFILPKTAQAVRVFTNCINSDDHQFGQSPNDYTLFRLGNFDDSNGQFLLARSLESIGNGVEFLAQDVHPHKEVPENVEVTRITQKPNGPSVLDGSPSQDSES